MRPPRPLPARPRHGIPIDRSGGRHPTRMKAKKAQPPFVNFSMVREYPGRDGLWNPRDGAPPLEAGFQVNVFGSREHYLRLAEFLRAFAEQDTSHDGDHHEHFEGIASTDGKVRLHLILRKDDVGDSSWRDHFPKPARPKPARPRRKTGAK